MGVGVQPSFTTVDRPPARQSTNALASAPAATTATTAKSKEKPYVKPGVGKCYKCGEPEHRSNECPKRKQVNMADYENNEEEGFEIEELNDFDFAEEHGESATCVVL